MTGKEIIANVLKRTRVSRSDFFGRFRSSKITAARHLAITEMTDAGLTVLQIARAIGRNHATVMYWQSADMRARRKNYYAIYNSEKKVTGPSKRKTNPEQRQKLLDLWGAGLRDAVMTMQAELGVHGNYTQRLACEVRLRDLRARGIEPPKRRAKRQPQKLRISKAIAAEPVKPMREERPVRIPPGAIEAARLRAAAARSLTAVAFGDPPPGYSALDRRNTEARV